MGNGKITVLKTYNSLAHLIIANPQKTRQEPTIKISKMVKYRKYKTIYHPITS